MKMVRTGANTTLLVKDRSVVLFSYDTPVVVVSGSLEAGVAYVTATKYSRTISKHVNRFLSDNKLACRAYQLDQAEFDRRFALV